MTADMLAGAQHEWIILREKESWKGMVNNYSKDGAQAIDELTKAP